MELRYNFQPRPWQQEVIAKQKRFSVLALHRRAGKTYLSCNILILKALSKEKSDIGLYCYIAPELKQARLIAWDLLKEIIRPFTNIGEDEDGKAISLVEIRESDSTIIFKNSGSRITLFGADDPNRIRGLKIRGAIVDEVAQMPKELWYEALRPTLADTHGWAMFIGTPNGINVFSELYYNAQRQDRPEWIAMHFTVYETQALPPEEIEAIKQETPVNVFEREWMANFNATADDQLISLDDLHTAANREVDDTSLIGEPLLMGVDVGRFGDDPSVITFRRGNLAEQPIMIHGADTVELANIVNQYYHQRHPTAVFVDGTGLGAGVVDQLTHHNIFVYDINFSGKPVDPQYANKRTYMYFLLKDWIKQGGCIPNDTGLLEEIGAITYSTTNNGLYQLERKKDIKHRLGRSVDRADSLALTFAEPIQKQVKDEYAEFADRLQRPDEYTPEKFFRRSIQDRKPKIVNDWWSAYANP
jgi:hypothetical protein